MPYCRCGKEFSEVRARLGFDSRPAPVRGPRRSRGPTKRRFFAVLHTDRINSPLEAVRAAIVAERRTTR